MMRCAIWYHLYKLKNVKNTHGGVLLLVSGWLKACNFTESNTPPWVFFMFFKLCKWYQIAQRITNANYLFQGLKKVSKARDFISVIGISFILLSQSFMMFSV